MDKNDPIDFRKFWSEPVNRYTLIVSLSIVTFMLLEQIYLFLPRFLASIDFRWLEQNYPKFIAPDDRIFSQGFIEWFGAFYGFLLPLLLVRAWEQLDVADREFDREVDAIKVLLEDITLLREEFLAFKKSMVIELKQYVEHILVCYRDEHREFDGGEIDVYLEENGLKEIYLIEKDPNVARKKYLKIWGDDILQGMRSGYKSLIYRGGGPEASQLEPLTTELLDRLNEAIDVRGDRISIFGQRLFESLWQVAIFTSLIWLVPFYFLPLTLGPFGGLLKLAVTFLIIFILTIIHDLDDPFTGYWQVTISSWLEVRDEIDKALKSLLEEEKSVTIEMNVGDTKSGQNKTKGKKPSTRRNKPKAH